MVEAGKPNPALEQAGKLSYDDIEAAVLGSASAAQQAPENKNGSFERFMMTLGARGGAKPGQ